MTRQKCIFLKCQVFGEQCPDGWFSIGTDSLGYPKPLKIALFAAARFCETLRLPRQYHTVTETLNKLDDEDLYLQFEKRLKAVLDETDGIGWGFSEDLSDSYYSLKWVKG